MKRFLILTMILGAALTAHAGQGRGGGFARMQKTARMYAKSTADKIRAGDFALITKSFPQFEKSRMSVDNFAQVIENVRFNESTEPKLDNCGGKNRLKYLDYGIDASGPYIEILNPYAMVLEAQGKNIDSQDLELRLVHEASHLIGVGQRDPDECVDEESADEFANELFKVIEIRTPQLESNELQRVESRTYLRQSTGSVYFIVSLPKDKKVPAVCSDVRVIMMIDDAEQEIQLDRPFEIPNGVFKRRIQDVNLGILQPDGHVYLMPGNHDKGKGRTNGRCPYAVGIMNSQQRVIDGDLLLPQSLDPRPVHQFQFITPTVN